MDFVRCYFDKNEPLTDQITLFSSLFVQRSWKKVRTKVFNWSEVHLYRSNFLQNPYFNRYRSFPVLTKGKYVPQQCSLRYRNSNRFSFSSLFWPPKFRRGLEPPQPPSITIHGVLHYIVVWQWIHSFLSASCIQTRHNQPFWLVEWRPPGAR